MDLHTFLDFDYGPRGDETLRAQLEAGADPNSLAAPDTHAGEAAENLLHVAVRRRRLGAMGILLEYGADIDALNAYQKTVFAHAARRGFTEISSALALAGANISLNEADHLAIALVDGRLDAAREILQKSPGLARTGNPGEDRILADLAGRPELEPVRILVEAGANLAAPALDDGTPLHQTAWFGEPVNARYLVEAGAPLDIFDRVHQSSPLGWAVHGSRYSGDADKRQAAYMEIVQLLLDAGSALEYPDKPSVQRTYYERLLEDATDQVRPLLEAASP